MYTEKQNIG